MAFRWKQGPCHIEFRDATRVLRSWKTWRTTSSVWTHAVPNWTESELKAKLRREVGCRRGSTQDSLGSVPSVERFDEADFQLLERKRAEFGIECAICLADMSIGEDAAN